MATKKFIVAKDYRTNGIVYLPYFIKKDDMRYNNEQVDYFELEVDRRGKPADGQMKEFYDLGILKAVDEPKEDIKNVRKSNKGMLENLTNGGEL